jgi:hypothetical protein
MEVTFEGIKDGPSLCKIVGDELGRLDIEGDDDGKMKLGSKLGEEDWLGSVLTEGMGDDEGDIDKDNEGDDEGITDEDNEGFDEGLEVGATGASVGIKVATSIADILGPLRE